MEISIIAYYAAWITIALALYGLFRIMMGIVHWVKRRRSERSYYDKLWRK